MVCKGNICRSPYAEARARLLGVSALSCGIECVTGAPAHEAAIRNARRRDVELRPHRALAFAAAHLSPGDLILAMEPAQARRIAPRAHAAHAQVSLLGLWSGHPIIHDPYGLDDDAFQCCYARIDASLAVIRALLSPAPLAGPRPDD
jgi:protein-tyrosine phosphatase